MLCMCSGKYIDIYFIMKITFLFLPCLPFFRRFRFRLSEFFLPIRRFVLPDCVITCGSPFFLIPFRLIHSCFGASLPSLCFVCFGRIFSLSFLSFPSFRLRFFHVRVTIILPCCMRTLLSVASPSLWVINFSFFSFPLYYRSPFRCFVSCIAHPSFMGCLVACFAFLFLFPRMCAVLSRTLTVLLASLSFFLRWFPAAFSELCSLFSFLVHSLGHSLLSFLLLFFFSVLSGLYSAFVLHLSYLMFSHFQSFSSSAPLL